MITGRHPYSLELGQTLPQWVRSTISNSKTLQNVLDPILMNDVQAHQQKMAMVLGVALLCTRDNPQERPQMEDVLKMLVHIKTKPASSSRRRFSISSRQNSSTLRRTTSEIQRPTQPPIVQPFPHNPSLSDWTPTQDEIV
jgi:LRR receptor-like serine/threonine-protein kinase FLS2